MSGRKQNACGMRLALGAFVREQTSALVPTHADSRIMFTRLYNRQGGRVFV